MRILLVEDSWHVGQSMKTLFQLLGAEVAGPAATGAAAEHLLSEMTPDIALVDFHLRNGELATGLIDKLHDRGITVIVLTGYAELPESPKSVAAVLQKPLNHNLLLATLRTVTIRKPAL